MSSAITIKNLTIGDVTENVAVDSEGQLIIPIESFARLVYDFSLDDIVVKT